MLSYDLKIILNNKNKILKIKIKVITKNNIAKIFIIISIIFAKENLTAQWSGTNPVTTFSDVGLGITNPNAQHHVYQNFITSKFFSQFSPKPSTQLKIETEQIDKGDQSTNITPFIMAQILYKHSYNNGGGNFIGYIRNIFTAKSNGFVGIGTDNLTNTLDVEGSIECSNNINTNSLTSNTIKINNSIQIGTKKATFHPDAKLHVEGKVAAQHFVITKPTNWSDKVFQKEYKLRSLYEIEQFINQNKHLPDMPSEAEVMEKGYDANEMDALLIQKNRRAYFTFD